MAIRRIGDDDQQGDNLPWINEYLDSSGEPDDVSAVEKVKKTAKGLLVICKDFKGFIFAGSSSYEHLMAAIPVWKELKDLPYQVVGIAQRNGKLGLAVDDEFTCTSYVDKKGNVDFKPVNGTSGLDQQTGNPFLATITIPPTTDAREEAVTATPTTRKRKPF
jgi:hypothetical protein